MFHRRKQVTNTLSQKPSLICFHDCYKVSKTQSIPDQLPKPLPQDSIMQSLNLSSLLPSITHTQISTLTVWTDCYSSCRSDGQTFSIGTASPLLTSKEAQGWHPQDSTETVTPRMAFACNSKFAVNPRFSQASSAEKSSTACLHRAHSHIRKGGVWVSHMKFYSHLFGVAWREELL